MGASSEEAFFRENGTFVTLGLSPYSIFIPGAQCCLMVFALIVVRSIDALSSLPRTRLSCFQSRETVRDPGTKTLAQCVAVLAEVDATVEPSLAAGSREAGKLCLHSISDALKQMQCHEQLAKVSCWQFSRSIDGHAVSCPSCQCRARQFKSKSFSRLQCVSVRVHLLLVQGGLWVF